jgi:hypothetical protein
VVIDVLEIYLYLQGDVRGSGIWQTRQRCTGPCGSGVAYIAAARMAYRDGEDGA